MVDVDRLEELGQKIMVASVEAQYLGLMNVVGWLDAAFADIVGLVVSQRVEDARVERREREKAVELALDDSRLVD